MRVITFLIAITVHSAKVYINNINDMARWLSFPPKTLLPCTVQR